MKRRALLALLATSGCHGGRASLPFSRKLLELAKSATPLSDAEISNSVAELAHLAEMAGDAVRATPSQPPAAVVTELLFGRLGFAREVDNHALDFALLPGVLGRRRGSCVGLGTLFLALAETLDWSAAGVLMPGHFYVRVAAGAQHRNVELLRKGEAMPDAWYEQRFPIPGGTAPEYARPLSVAEVLGVLEYNVGNESRRLERFESARAAFTRAVVAFPDFAEAHASLGAMQQLLGQLEPAAASYRTALAKNPHLPGVGENLALLAMERGEKAAGPK